MCEDCSDSLRAFGDSPVGEAEDSLGGKRDHSVICFHRPGGQPGHHLKTGRNVGLMELGVTG